MMISPLFTALSFQHIPLLYLWEHLLQLSPAKFQKAANIPAFPVIHRPRKLLRKWEELPRKRAEQPKNRNYKYDGTHGSHAQMEADSTQAQEAPNHPVMSSKLSVHFVYWDLALSSTSLQHPLLYRDRAPKGSDREILSFPKFSGVG